MKHKKKKSKNNLLLYIICGVFICLAINTCNKDTSKKEHSNTFSNNTETSALNISTESITEVNISTQNTTDFTNHESEQIQNDPLDTTISFGKYGGQPIEWLVLDSDGTKSLIISKFIIEFMSFNGQKYAESCSWSRSAIRIWLNNDFYNAAFDNKERELIQLTTVQDYSKNKTLGEQTSDYIFILSYDQAWSYFKDDKARATLATEYARKHTDYISNSWWLINSSYLDIYKYVVNSKGGQTNSPRVNEKQGVRPALWISNDYFEK